MDTPKDSTPAVETAKKLDSVVDNVFDALYSLTARGLAAAKKGLEASARWLDGRAKVAGDLANKFAHRA